METPSQSPQIASAPRPNLDLLIMAIGHKSRWKLLKELTHGEPRTLLELTHVIGCSYQNTSNHLAILRRLGIVVQGRGRLYQIPAHFLPEPGKPLLDCGHCLLRMDALT
jgi:hypothetical protein